MSDSVSISVGTAAFAEQLKWVDRFIEKKTTIPILAHVLVRFDGSSLTLTGTDLEVSGECSISVGMAPRQDGFSSELPEPFACTVPSKPMVKLLSSLKSFRESLTLTYDRLVEKERRPNPDKPGEFFEEIATLKLTVSDGDTTVTYDALSDESYPQIPQAVEPLCRIGNAQLALKRGLLAISPEASRFTLNGALLDLYGLGDDIGVRGCDAIVSTDGHRLSCQLIPTSYTRKPHEKFVLMRKFLFEVLNVLKLEDLDTVDLFDLAEDEANNRPYVAARIGNRYIAARTLTGNFPDYGRVMPKQFTGTIKLNSSLLLAALKKILPAVPAVSEKPFRIATEESGSGHMLVLTAKSEGATMNAQVPAVLEGITEFSSGYNVGYVIDAVSLMPETTEFLCNHWNEPVELQDSAGGWRYVLMPHGDKPRAEEERRVAAEAAESELLSKAAMAAQDQTPDGEGVI